MRSIDSLAGRTNFSVLCPAGLSVSGLSVSVVTAGGLLQAGAAAGACHGGIEIGVSPAVCDAKPRMLDAAQ